jgi:glutamate N-acetyltransferase/amino-acid N-acetyltransferase
MTELKSPLTRVPGFRAVGVSCGLKESGQPDLTLVLADYPCAAAAVFTSNAFKAAPVLYDLALLERTKGTLQAVVINAGNANAITGEQGLRDAEQMARLTESACGLPVDSAFVMSTGVIGHKMPMEKIEKGIHLASREISTEAGVEGREAARAIMTTDLVPKEAFVQATINGQAVSLGGVAKGSGMIHPQLGTMLAVIVTDAMIEPVALDAALRQVVACTFNRVTVDGDTSPNDTVIVLASGQADQSSIPFSPHNTLLSLEFNIFLDALTQLCTSLAKAIARDGEGATKLVEITVRGAATEVEAEIAAKTVATPPLMKTALFGNDPNWGRALAAIGRSGVAVDPDRTSLQLGDFRLVASGEPLDFDVVAASNWLANSDEIKLVADLGVGQAEATVWSCDLSYKYVEINAEYHT